MGCITPAKLQSENVQDYGSPTPSNCTHIFHAINMHATAQIWRYKCLQALLQVTLKIHPLPTVIITADITQFPAGLAAPLPVTLFLYQWTCNTLTSVANNVITGLLRYLIGVVVGKRDKSRVLCFGNNSFSTGFTVVKIDR